MTEPNQQFDDLERHVSDRLRQDLRGLFEPPGVVPAGADKTILDQAHRQLAKPRHIVIRLRWAAGITAAAAVIVLGVILFNPQSAIMSPPAPTGGRNPQSLRPALAEARADIDHNGRVDILDAFRLARSIEARGPTDPRWDLNGDGRIDKDDVDLVASAAVRLDSTLRGEGVPPLRPEAILASLFHNEDAGSETRFIAFGASLPLSNRGQDARDTQGQDALATNSREVPLNKGV